MAGTAPLCLVVQLAKSEAAVGASLLGSVAVAARLLPAPWHFCSVVLSKIDGEVRLLAVAAEDSHLLFEPVLGIRRGVTRFLLRALVCHWDWPLRARQQETAALLMTIKM